jgi:hypothetical protein
MKYIKLYEDFTMDKEFIMSEIRDILIDISMENIKIGIHNIEQPLSGILVMIGDPDGRQIRLNKYKENFNHLFSVMQSTGYMLNKNKSYVENKTWDLHITCDCGSEKIEYVQEGLRCMDCGYTGVENFEYSSEYKISLDEFKSMIQQKYWVNYIEMTFEQK